MNFKLLETHHFIELLRWSAVAPIQVFSSVYASKIELIFLSLSLLRGILEMFKFWVLVKGSARLIVESGIGIISKKSFKSSRDWYLTRFISVSVFRSKEDSIEVCVPECTLSVMSNLTFFLATSGKIILLVCDFLSLEPLEPTLSYKNPYYFKMASLSWMACKFGVLVL